MDKFEIKKRIRDLLDKHLWPLRYSIDFCEEINQEAELHLSNRALDKMIVEVVNDNNVYLGESEKGLREGYGFEYSIDGVLYMGEWHENKYHGRGYLFSNHHCFCGLFSKGSYCDNTIITGAGVHMLLNQISD